MQFALQWIHKGLRVPLNQLRIYLHLYKDMNVLKEMKYWSDMLGLPLRQFTKPYLKDSNRSDIDQKGFGHGTCGIRVYDTEIKERVLIGIRVVAGHIVRKAV